MIEASLYSKLASESSVTDIVSTRIYPAYAPQNTQIPYITFSQYTSEVNELMGANADIESASYSFVIVSQDYDEARNGVKAVKDVLERWERSTGQIVLHSSVIRYTPIIYNKDLEAYHRGVDMNFHYRPSTL